MLYFYLHIYFFLIQNILLDLLGGTDLTSPTATDLSNSVAVQRKNSKNANETSNNQAILDLLDLDISASTTTNTATNMNNVLGLDLSGSLSTSIPTTTATNGNDLSSIMSLSGNGLGGGGATVSGSGLLGSNSILAQPGNGLISDLASPVANVTPPTSNNAAVVSLKM